MRLKKLELKNWGPHESLVCDLDSPLTGIIGANGKGKSFLLTAISYAITGVLPLNKEKYLRNYDPEDENKHGKAYRATVKLQFEAKDQDGTITREIWDSGTSRSLEYGGEKINKQSEVDARIDQLVGADRAALLNAVFIRQGELTDLVKGTPANRQEIFRRLMNLNFLENRLQDISAKLLLLSGEMPDYTGEIERLGMQLKGVMEEVIALKEKQPSQEEEEACAKKIELIAKFEKIHSNTLLPNSTLKTSLQSKVLGLQSQLASFGDEKELQENLEETKKRYILAQDTLSRLEKLQTLQNDIEQWYPIGAAIAQVENLEKEYGTEESLQAKVTSVKRVLEKRDLTSRKQELEQKVNGVKDTIAKMQELLRTTKEKLESKAKDQAESIWLLHSVSYVEKESELLEHLMAI